MVATVENGVLVVRIPMTPPVQSSTGKTCIVASGQAKPVGLLVQGKQVTVSLNAYYKP